MFRRKTKSGFCACHHFKRSLPCLASTDLLAATCDEGCSWGEEQRWSCLGQQNGKHNVTFHKVTDVKRLKIFKLLSQVNSVHNCDF